jgi:hypothetical protein
MILYDICYYDIARYYQRRNSKGIHVVAAIRHIHNLPHVSSENSTRDKRKEIVIFLKLFTITGCSWIFQIIELATNSTL